MTRRYFNLFTTLTVTLSFLVVLASCSEDKTGPAAVEDAPVEDATDSKPGAAPQPGSDGVVVETSGTITTSASGLTSFSTTIPSGVVSMGLILLGTNADLKFVEHENILGTGIPGSITGPGGSSVPLSFNMWDSDGNGTFETRVGDNLLNRQATTLLFLNDGSSGITAGAYTFPIGSADASTGLFNVDTIQPYVLYKTIAGTGQTMDVNLFVISGVSPGITTAAAALADAEISGAITVLRNVFQINTNLGLILNITVSIVSDTSFISIDSSAEQDTLLRSYPPALTSDGLNLFVVGELNYLPAGVIGLSAGIPGPFNLHGTVVSGTLAEYNGDGTGTILGFTLAHEFGHFLGLWHTSQTNSGGTEIRFQDPISDTMSCTTADLSGPLSPAIDNCPDRDNLMFPFVSNDSDPPITAGQAQVILNNPAIYP